MRMFVIIGDCRYDGWLTMTSVWVLSSLDSWDVCRSDGVVLDTSHSVARADHLRPRAAARPAAPAPAARARRRGARCNVPTFVRMMEDCAYTQWMLARDIRVHMGFDNKCC